MKYFKVLLKQDELSLGLYITSKDPSTIEKAKEAGFDFIRIDNEHIMFDYSDLERLIRTANSLSLPVEVRVSNLHDITKLLDFGATGIVVPNINSVKRAQEAIGLTKFPPFGYRGMYPPARSIEIAGYSSFTEYYKIANDMVTLSLQIEDRKAMQHIDEIVSLEGIDILSSGKADISQSVGLPGQINHEEVIAIEDMIIKKAIEYGKQPVIMTGNKDRFKEIQSMGVKAIIVGLDNEILSKAFKNTIHEMKGLPLNKSVGDSYRM